eukprot:m.57580 g.57580  ORF g.57580 m.57580 type:complete len:183 (+) comp22409_c0_seq1:145-693(+)
MMSKILSMSLLAAVAVADNFPQLNTITTRTITSSYSCGTRTMADSCLTFDSSQAPGADNCDVLLNGGCGDDTYFQVNLAGAEMGFISNIGDVALENITSYVAMTPGVTGFLQSQNVVVGEVYVMILARSDHRAMFIMKVTSSNSTTGGLTAQTAVRLYESLDVTKQSPGFSWDANNTSPTRK